MENGIKTLPQAQVKDIAPPEVLEPTPEWEAELETTKKRRCCKRRSKDEEELIEHVEIHLDGWGKHGLTFVFSLMQFAIIYTFCLFYYQYYTHTCNPSVYTIDKSNQALNLLGL